MAPVRGQVYRSAMQKRVKGSRPDRMQVEGSCPHLAVNASGQRFCRESKLPEEMVHADNAPCKNPEAILRKKNGTTQTCAFYGVSGGKHTLRMVWKKLQARLRL